MTRLLFWIALIILVVMAVRSKLRAAMARAQGPAAGMGPGPTQAAGAQRVADASERMTNCAHCGIYFPVSEAVTAGGREYCSPAHAHLPAVDKPPR
jgi:uncharacterized protein